MQRQEVQLRGAESWGGGAGAGRRVRPLRARSSRLAALSRPARPFDRASGRRYGAVVGSTAASHMQWVCQRKCAGSW